ncbi:unnamed protein product, partial [Symbiodinium sp. CCMP2456]
SAGRSDLPSHRAEEVAGIRPARSGKGSSATRQRWRCPAAPGNSSHRCRPRARRCSLCSPGLPACHVYGGARVTG